MSAYSSAHQRDFPRELAQATVDMFNGGVMDRSNENSLKTKSDSQLGSSPNKEVQPSTCGFGKHLNQLAAKIGNVSHDAAPHQVSLSKGRFIRPSASRVDNIILDAK